jgi:hypothetical protein
MHHLMGLVPPDQSALSLGRPLCVRRGSSGLQNQTGALPHHAWAGRRETTGPRLAPGGWWGHVQMSNASLVPPSVMPGVVRFVFVRPRPDTVISSTPAHDATLEELAKR